ncbi:MAG TPA: sialidase family protein, partial [Kribbella sp.]|uniref:sialidase family protein n=1 Tax=Kribbella sp. TaxID=1871183 RepID=UPI002D79CA81
MIRVFSRNGSRRRAGVAALVAALCVGVMPLAEAAQPSADQASTSFFQEDVILRQGTLGYSCFRIPTLVKAVDGTLLLFVEGRINNCADAGNIDLLLTRSTDGGKSWLPLQVLIKGDGETRGNPTPIVDKVTGRIALLSMRSPGNNWTPRTPYLQTSEDNGLTWTEPKDISAQITEPDWKYWYATGPVHGIQLEHGPHAGRLVAATYFSPPSESDRGAALVYSDDGGLSWNLGAVDKQEIDRAGETTVVELEDGRLYVSTRSSAAAHDFPGHRGYAYSSDGGESFDRPFAAEDELPTPEIQGSLLRLNAKSQGDARNRILFSAPANPAAREAMTVRSSFDESKRWETWQQGKVISWGPAAYSDMTEIADGLVGLAYEAGGFAPYESIRFARFNEAYLDTPNTKPPAVPGPPVPGPTTPDLARSRDP